MFVNILILAAVIFWGLSFIGTKMALDYLTPIEIIAFRMLVGVPVIGLAVYKKGRPVRFRFGDYPIIITASVILGFHFLIQAAGLMYTSATNTAWLIATIPVFIAIASRIFLKEKISLKMSAGIMAGALGVLLLVSRGDWGNIDRLYSIGDWIILGSCVTWTIYTIITRRITAKYDPLALSFAFLILPAAVLVGVTAVETPLSKFIDLPIEILLILVFLGIFSLGLAHWFWIEGLARKGAAEVGVFLYLEPIVTTVAAIPLLGEKLNILGILGALFILGGVYIVQRSNRSRQGR
jgi:drug/metabolite transporter (DMT)-like permease